MNAVKDIVREATGDRNLRLPDFDTVLIGPINDSIIDADRLAQRHCNDFFPNFAMYRAVLAGDSLYIAPLRQWCVAFTDAYAKAGGVRADAYSETFSALAAWDALHTLIHNRAPFDCRSMACIAGVRHETYKRLKTTVYKLLRAALNDYWCELGIAIRRVKQREREAEAVTPRGRWTDGTGMDGMPDVKQDGNYWALKKNSH